MISVIIPVYNSEKTVERCVESIIFGQFRKINVILVDDCSTDGSWEICQSLSRKYENVYSFQNEQNRGVSYTRNHGLKKANGEYIMFVDSDDWVSGKYALKLFECAKKYETSLVICGLHFHDNTIGEKRDYVWEKDGEGIYIIEPKQFFELQKRFHLQQLWNKIFRRDIIEQHDLCFDETQSMGEDFQFVLDYMEVAKCKQCVVLNEPLYYYIRANDSSLMSQFGMIENGNEYKRLEKLLKISGEDVPEIQQQYFGTIREIKATYVYHIARAKNKTKAEKLTLIENVMKDNQFKIHYRRQKKIMVKETIISIGRNICKLKERARGKLQRAKNKKTIETIRSYLENDKFTIISQNCIGGVFYHDMEKKFLSPTINLFFRCSDFVRFVLNLKYYMEVELQMKWEEEYPVGVLDDVKIYFMHYGSCTEAKTAWENRKSRICWDKILVLSTDMEDFDDEVLKSWKQIHYPKILFTAKQWEDNDIICFPEYESYGRVLDLIPKREFYKNNVLISKINRMKN